MLVQSTKEASIRYRLRGRTVDVPTHGVRATIIDYTLSRICCGAGNVVFNDLAMDNDLFESGGDYQFDVYRLMRSHLANNWSLYDPFTNVLWLHYVVDKMVKGVHYTKTSCLAHWTAIDELTTMRKTMLANCASSTDVVDKFFADAYF